MPVPHSGGMRALTWLTAWVTVLVFWHCAPESPPTEEWVKLELNDSLSAFDSVHIDLIDPNDTNRVLQVLWSGRLPDPSRMPEQRLTLPDNQPYQVRIRAWNEEKELGWESIIIKTADSTKTLRTNLPPLRPYLVDLASLSSSRGDFDPQFQPARANYNLSLGFMEDSLLLRAAPADERATVKFRRGTVELGKDSAYLAIPEGSSEVTIDVTNKGDRSRAYKVVVLRPQVPNPRLRKLKPAAGALVPDFHPEQTRYRLAVSNTVNRLAFDEFAADSFATVQVGRDTLRSGAKPNSILIPVGDTTIGISLSALTRSMAYSIQVTRAKAPDTLPPDTIPPDTSDTTTPPPPPPPKEPPHLLKLTVAEGAFSPPFNDLVHEYTLTVNDTVSSLHVTEIISDTGVSMRIGSEVFVNGSLPKPIPLVEGDNAVTISLTGNATQLTSTYTLTVYKNPPFRLAGFPYTSRIRVNTTSSGANVINRVVGFPILLRLRAPDFDFSTARKDGQDIRLVKIGGGSMFPFEIESWDSARGIADIWVRIDTIAGNRVQDVAYLCWGNPTAPGQGSAADVFSPADGFAAVWHMDSGFTDATGNNNIGYGRSSPQSVPEKLSGPVLKTDGIRQGVDFGNNIALNNLGTTIQFEGWLRAGSNSALASVFKHGEHFIPLQLLANGGARTSLYTRPQDQSRLNDSLKVINLPNTVNWNDSAWHQIVAYYESNTGLVVYWDGRVASTNTSIRGPLFTSGKPYMVALGENNDEAYNGLTDEVRVQNRIRSADWVKLNYEIVKPGSKAVILVK